MELKERKIRRETAAVPLENSQFPFLPRLPRFLRGEDPEWSREGLWEGTGDGSFWRFLKLPPMTGEGDGTSEPVREGKGGKSVSGRSEAEAVGSLTEGTACVTISEAGGVETARGVEEDCGGAVEGSGAPGGESRETLEGRREAEAVRTSRGDRGPPKTLSMTKRICGRRALRESVLKDRTSASKTANWAADAPVGEGGESVCTPISRQEGRPERTGDDREGGGEEAATDAQDTPGAGVAGTAVGACCR